MIPSRARKGRASRVARLTIGCLLTAGGAILAVPLVPGPGFLLLLGGIALLSAESPAVRRLLRRLRDWRLMRRAMHEAARAGVRLGVDEDEEEGQSGGPPSGLA
ncbi:MAG: PGPGW domain-containing protein [Acidobacteriota bacterium]